MLQETPTVPFRRLAEVKDPPPNPESVRSDVADAVRAELDQGLWDIRLAAILNLMDIARAHGEQRDWTSTHAAQIRAMMTIADAAVVGDPSSIVPQGFGPPVRTQLGEAFLRARDKAKAAGAVGGKPDETPAPPESA